MMLKLLDIDALETLERAATPGEWWQEPNHTLIWGVCNPDTNASYRMGFPILDARLPTSWQKDHPTYDERMSNSAFVVAIRNAAPELFKAIRDRDEARNARDYWRIMYHTRGE
jgi:hypothetical protein